MMTTEDRSETRFPGTAPASLQVGVLGAVALLAVVVAASMIALGALVDGSDGALGALTGAGIGLVVFGFGVGTLAVVARLLPSATLLVALLTFGVQAFLLILLFVRLSHVAFYADGPGRLWYGLGLVAVTLAWMLAQLVLTARQALAAEAARVAAQRASDGPTGGES